MKTKTTVEVEESAVTSYLETLLWTGILNCGEGESVEIEGDEYEDGTPLDQIPGCDVSDLPEEMRESALEDLVSFGAYCAETIGLNPFSFFDQAQVAHDFALSRNRHGAGFFDRDYSIVAQGPAGTPTNNRDARYSDSIRSEGVKISDELQDCARTFGTHGLMGYVDEEGSVKVEDHG